MYNFLCYFCALVPNTASSYHMTWCCGSISRSHLAHLICPLPIATGPIVCCGTSAVMWRSSWTRTKNSDAWTDWCSTVRHIHRASCFVQCVIKCVDKERKHSAPQPSYTATVMKLAIMFSCKLSHFFMRAWLMCRGGTLSLGAPWPCILFEVITGHHMTAFIAVYKSISVPHRHT
jgi:hypothetical protein